MSRSTEVLHVARSDAAGLQRRAEWRSYERRRDAAWPCIEIPDSNTAPPPSAPSIQRRRINFDPTGEFALVSSIHS